MNLNEKFMSEWRADAEMADEIFSILMGSVVDPRKLFIEKYAKDVRWIDV